MVTVALLRQDQTVAACLHSVPGSGRTRGRSSELCLGSFGWNGEKKWSPEMHVASPLCQSLPGVKTGNKEVHCPPSVLL